jgi:hypothetical protein
MAPWKGRRVDAVRRLFFGIGSLGADRVAAIGIGILAVVTPGVGAFAIGLVAD